MKFRKIEEKDTSTFIKLKDKESVVGVLAGDIFEYFSLWENKKPRLVPEGTPGAKFRFRINLVVKDGTNFIPKVFEGGVAVYRHLEELSGEYSLEQTYLKITRNGEGLDTTYSIIPSRMQVSAADLIHIKKLKLNDVSDFEKKDHNSPPPLEEANFDEIPF